MSKISLSMRSGYAAVALVVLAVQTYAAPSPDLSTANKKSVPSLRLTLKPHATDGVLDYIDATMVIHGLRVTAGKPLLRMALIVASIPTVRYDDSALTASDAKGPLPLIQKDAAPTPVGIDRD